jgi:condensin complex subunit 3
MPARTRQPNESLEQYIPRIFNQVQDSAANHKKNHVALHKIQAELAEHTEELQNGKLVRLTGERMFQDKFIYMFCKALPLKKGIVSADRTVKFVAEYVKFINEKGAVYHRIFSTYAEVRTQLWKTRNWKKMTLTTTTPMLHGLLLAYFGFY